MLTGLLLHELGHSFLYHHWHGRAAVVSRRAFGEVRKAYRVADEHWWTSNGAALRRRSRLRQRLRGDAPAGRFAETFRFYVRGAAGCGSCSLSLVGSGKV